MMRAARLDAQLYEEVEADSGATGQAMVVVALASLAAGFGTGGGDVKLIVVGVLSALVGWFIWALMIYLIGTKILPTPQTEATVGQLLRTIGFSSSPGLLRVLGGIPVLGPAILVVSSVWMLVAMVIAVRQALDYTSTGRAIGVCLIGWVIQIVVIAVPLALLGEATMGGAG
jgi:hypothetical protein